MNLKEYIQGYRKGKEANRIERDALKDPFLYEALEGFDTVPEDHAKRIEDLQKLITKASNPARRLWLRWSVAATILLLISFGGYLFFTNTEKDTKPLVSQNTENSTPTSQSKEMEDTQHTTQTTIETQQSEQSTPIIIAQNSSEKRVQSAAIEVQKQMNSQEVEQEVTLVEKLVVVDKTPADALGVADMDAKQMNDRLVAVTAIRGVVTDQYGMPLIGATIMQEGETKGVISGVDGRFEMKIDSVKSLSVNYVGFVTQEIQPTQFSSSMKISLIEDQSASLSEVVVTAYGTSKKSTITEVRVKEYVSKSEPIIGKKAYEQYLKDNMVHPIDERGKQISGKVKLSFYIDAQGRPIDITIEKSLSTDADAEAIRLIKEGADWALSLKKVAWTISF